MEIVYPEVRVLLSPGQDPGDGGQGRHVGPAGTVGRVVRLRPLGPADEPLTVLRSYGRSLQDVAEEPELAG